MFTKTLINFIQKDESSLILLETFRDICNTQVSQEYVLLSLFHLRSYLHVPVSNNLLAAAIFPGNYSRSNTLELHIS